MKIKKLITFVRTIKLSILCFGLSVVSATKVSSQSSSCASGSGQICNPLQGNDNVLVFFGTILDKVIIPVGAIAAFVFLLYSGFLFVTAGGDEGKIKTAKQNITYVVIGAAIILGAKVISAGIQGTLDTLK